MPTAIDEIDQRDGNRHHSAGYQKGGRRDAIDGSIHGGGKFGELFLSEQARKKGKRRLADSLSENCDGYGEEALGIVQPCDVADSARGKVAEDPVVGGNERDAEHQRDGEPHPLAECRILYVERGPVSGADFSGSDRVDQKWSGDASGEGAEGK